LPSDGHTVYWSSVNERRREFIDYQQFNGILCVRDVMTIDVTHYTVCRRLFIDEVIVILRVQQLPVL